MNLDELRSEVALGEDSRRQFKLDRLRFRDFLQNVYQKALPDDPAVLLTLLQNMNLATEGGALNLAGVLLFAERPEWIQPQFILKAIHFPGRTIHPTTYLDSEDIAGPLSKIFNEAMGFVMRSLHKVQAGRGVNSPGQPEIPAAVFEELLVNALVHRDYLVSAPIRLFIFEDRIEIISPGHLPDNLTVAKIRAGNSNIRNPILVSYAAKGLLPYRGLGSGITRALESWPDIKFLDDRDGCLFTAVIARRHGREAHGDGSSSQKSSHKTPVGRDLSVESSQKTSPNSSQKSSQKILDLMAPAAGITIAELAAALGLTDRAVKKQIANLKASGRIRRVGPDKGGHWEVTG
jgi:ATP-dependent DNA helicase RecG